MPAKAAWIDRLIAELIDGIAWALALLPVAALGAVGGTVGGAVGVVLFLVGLAASIGSGVWVASRYQDGRSVGKRVMGTQVVRAADGYPLNLASNLFVRAILVKGLVVGIAGSITFQIFWLVNYLWPLWDANAQAVHHKMVSTYVVKLR
jgi:uncharacterized RDD family membrane protein YckC